MDNIHKTDQPLDAVTFNDITLSADQLAEFEKIYKLKPRPGRYWYDKMCGLYGLFGQPALGYLYAGHDYGTLARNASNGNTRVLINNRELTQFEWMMLSQLLGAPVMPGNYWVDAQGNAGMQGNPAPLVNLFMAAQQNAYNAGRGGDNFWSSRYAAGNSTSDGSAGYINLGGGESVTWGM